MNCQIGKRTITWLAAFVVAFGFVSTASAQVFTGRMDVVIEDATGGRLPGVSVDITGPVNQTQVTDAQGQAHFLNLPVGTYAVKAELSGFNSYANNSVQVVSGSSTPMSVRLGVAGTSETINVTAAIAAHRPQAQHDDDERDAGGAAEHSERARPMGRHADRPHRLHGSRQRRRRGIGPAVGLQRERRAGQGQHLEHRWRAGHRHGRHRGVRVLLRLRQLPGNGGDHRRRRRAEPDRRRPAEHGAAQGRQHTARQRALVLRERRRCSRSTSRRSWRRRSATRRARATAPIATRITASTSAARS